MTKTRMTIQQETNVPTQDDGPTVVAYRVGSLEKRFDTFEQKLDNLGGNFVTVGALREMKEVADNEHRNFRIEIDTISSKISSYPLIEKIVFAGVGIILITILGAGLSLVILK